MSIHSDGEHATGHTRTSRTLISIQCLRFVAAAAVVATHSSYYANRWLDDSFDVYLHGANGIRLFFVISGLVMGLTTARKPRVSDFLISRIIRIVPLYWMVTTVVCLIAISVPAFGITDVRDVGFVIRSFLFIPAANVAGQVEPVLGVGWTLNLEMAFYLLVTLALLTRISPVRFAAGPLAVCAGLGILDLSNLAPAPFNFYLTPLTLDFLVGLLIASHHRPQAGDQPILGAVVAIFGLLYLFVAEPFVPSIQVRGVLGSLAAGCVVYGALRCERQIATIAPRWLRFGGNASYSLYLLHPLAAPMVPLILSFYAINLGWLSVLMSFCLSLATGALCYVFVERPLSSSFARILKSTRQAQ